MNQKKQQNNYTFIATGYSKHLECTFCGNLMADARRFHPCGHTFCHQCAGVLQQNPKSNRKCPNCQIKVKAVQPDLLVKNMVGQLMVKCLNKDCSYKGQFQVYMKNHSKSCIMKQGLDKWLETIGKLTDRVNNNKKNQENQNLNEISISQNNQTQKTLKIPFQNKRSSQYLYENQQNLSFQNRLLKRHQLKLQSGSLEN